jgi:hypothetical protein
MASHDAILNLRADLTLVASKYKIDLADITRELLQIVGSIHIANRILPRDAPAHSYIKQGIGRTINVCSDLVTYLHGGEHNEDKYGALSPADENANLNFAINIDHVMTVKKDSKSILTSFEYELQQVGTVLQVFCEAGK